MLVNCLSILRLVSSVTDRCAPSPKLFLHKNIYYLWFKIIIFKLNLCLLNILFYYDFFIALQSPFYAGLNNSHVILFRIHTRKPLITLLRKSVRYIFPARYSGPTEYSADSHLFFYIRVLDRWNASDYSNINYM